MCILQQGQVLGVGMCKKTKDLSTHEREESEYGEGRDVYATLLKSDIVQSYGHTKTVTRWGLISEKKQRT